MEKEIKRLAKKHGIANTHIESEINAIAEDIYKIMNPNFRSEEIYISIYLELILLARNAQYAEKYNGLKIK